MIHPPVLDPDYLNQEITDRLYILDLMKKFSSSYLQQYQQTAK
ncbi:hypothetical protein D934_10425 [Xylella fastidiosa subsp. sandyi Ann-1]|uniref:Uncharacterized protein n=1 Tax=Xylella fastidiosa subsp. sandyi Ann-1 TaxID=155920 RepID=A0A060H7H4_XYLFS|nr:hypothetical protein D934_10425 [Xylella fastidiosa subsp. sandyi Ann-1]